jgi:hypothetical protein
MSANNAMSVLSAIEFLMWAALGFCFWKKALYRRFPAMAVYLGLHAVAAPLFTGLLYLRLVLSKRTAFEVYYFSYWAVYLVSAILLFFICMEVFSNALEAVPGLKKLGTLAFRWAAIACIVLSLASVSYQHSGHGYIAQIANTVMRSASVMELCLLAFLALCMNALNISALDSAFGLSMGFGLLAANDFIQSLTSSIHTSLTAPWQFVYQSTILCVIGGWIAFFALPERVRKPVLLPASSLIFRWNEIATALGHSETQVALQTANSSLLSDVQQVADRIFAHRTESNESQP